MSDEGCIARHSKVLAVVTPTFNSSSFIEDCVKSVDSQHFKPYEHIIIDGASHDNTLSLIPKANYRIVTSEVDHGLYDAMNKGFKKSNSEYVIVLNSDDYFHNEKVTQNILKLLTEYDFPDLLCGSIEYVKRNTQDKVRRYKSSDIDLKSFLKGIAPPHPAVVMKRSLFLELGGFDLNYKIAADFDLLLRAFSKSSIRIAYTDLVITTMRTGGASDQSVKAHLIGLKEKKLSLKKNGYKVKQLKLILGHAEKLKQFFVR